MNKKHRRKPDMELSLCSGCASVYYDSKKYWIERTSMNQRVCDECSICRRRPAYDFKIWRNRRS